MRPLICLLSLQLWVILSATGPCAQSDNALLPPSGTSEATAAVAVESSVEAGAILFRTPQGQLVPVADLLGNGIVEEILQRVEGQRNEPRFTVSQLEVEGSIDQDEVRLKIDLQIQVNSVKEWVIVPLALGDVYLAGPPKAVSSAVNGQSMITTGEKSDRQEYLSQFC